MRRINLLPQETANKIAAGEVVERASSVVKELVENSIDAGSKNIIIEIEESGSKLIRICDDGEGIHPDDIEKAFLAHATSKISIIEDIFSINTFGFRGEALPSIAAISKVTIQTKTKEFDFGKEMYLEGGEIKYIRDTGCNVGTTIEIRDLFYNVPARQKFLKSPQRENALISDLVLRLALGNNEVTFKLYSNGKDILSCIGSKNSKDTIRILYGKQVFDNIVFFENHSDIISVHGFIGNSEISRGSRNRQSIFVNKRLIKSSLITAAVENAFKSFITVNKFPFFVINIDIFPDFIDPNVHPTKAEIKFFDEKSLYKLIFDGVHLALRESLRSTFQIDLEDSETSFDNNTTINASNIDFKEKSSEASTQVELPLDFNNRTIKNNFINSLNMTKETDAYQEDKVFKDIENKSTFKITEVIEPYNKEAGIVLKNIYNENSITSNTNNYVNENRDAKEYKNPKFPIIRVIGQFNNSYIIGEYNAELYLIDQHAAHEKVYFEQYKKSIDKAQVMSQILLSPYVLELNFEDYAFYSENIEIFRNCGFVIEEFGDNTIAIREVPIFLGKPDVKNLFYDIIENIKKLGSGTTVEVKYNKIASLACKSAVKANNKLSQIEMEALMEDLRYLEEPFTCPHGRPTIIKFSLYELEKRFKRIQ